MTTFSTIDYIKQFYSMALVIFSVVIVTALMFTENTKVARDAHPVVALITDSLAEGVAWPASPRTAWHLSLISPPMQEGLASSATAGASAELFKRISAAYEALRDGDSRKAYQRAVLAGRAD